MSVTDIIVDNFLTLIDKKDNKPRYREYQTRDIYEIITSFFDENVHTTDNPFFIVDIGDVIRKVNLWKKCLPNVTAYYAIKSNPDRILLNLLSNMGIGFDVASENEIILALSVTTPNNIIYANPTKENSHIRLARSRDVDLLTFDSECELKKFALIHPRAKLLLRLTVDDSGSECKLSKKFGCEMDNVSKLLNKAKILELNVVGFCFHVGSNCRIRGAFKSALKNVKLAIQTAMELGFTITIIDIGGGFPGIIDEAEYNDIINVSATPTFTEMTREITDALKEYELSEEHGYQVIAEPGRFFSTSSHTLVCNVIGYKEKLLNGEKIYQYTVNENIYASFNCIQNDYAKPIILPYNERDEKTYKSIVVGNTCDSLDTISQETYLPKLEVGDFVYVKNMGAYTVTSRSTFNGFDYTRSYYIKTI